MADARAYWNDRYGAPQRGPTSASGTFTHLEEANRWFYRAKFHRVQKILRAGRVRLAGARVLDAACGTGAFIPLWLKLGAARVTGLDLSDTAVAQCRRRFGGDPRCDFAQLDLAAAAPGPDAGRFDLVCVLEAIFLLTAERDFLTALRRLCAWVKPGGHLLFSDQMPETTVVRHERLTYHSRATYEKGLAAAGMRRVGRLRQSCLFNRHVFGEKLQPLVEARCPWLLYGLNQLLLWSPVKNPPGEDEIYYHLAWKPPPAG
jgi:SAM-dependent methyltransferase